MKSNKIIIFCQAPADIPFVLSIYEQRKRVDAISIFVINVEGMYRFLNDLKLDVEQLVFIPYQLRNVKQLWKLPAERKRIHTLYQKYFFTLEDATVYFFSRFEDWLTASFIAKLANKKDIRIIYLDHYDDTVNFDPSINNSSLSLRGYVLVLEFLTGINFEVKIIEKLPEFPINQYPITKEKAIVNQQVFSKYAYTSRLSDKIKSSVLFFVSACDSTIFNSIYYDEKVLEIIKTLQHIGYEVVVKGHPRIGLPEHFKAAADLEMPSYVPGELIDVNNFKICLGLDTNAISYFAKNEYLPTYSLLKILPSADEAMTAIIVDYLKNQSNNKIKFIENLMQFIAIAKTHLN